MRYIVLTFLCVLIFITAPFDLYAILNSKVVYVSSSQGSDFNSGITENDPLQHIVKALDFADTIYLKAGDVFWGGVNFTGKFVTRYGNGEDPLICGFKRIVHPDWNQVGKHIWKINLRTNNYVGVNNVDYLTNNIGCIYDYVTDKVYGRKVQYKNELAENWDFWQTDSFKANDIGEHSFDELYLYLTQNPNKLMLEFSTGTVGVQISYGKISHIKICGFGIHGISAGSNTDILDCTVDIIGGSIQIGYKNFICLGNGIQFYVAKNISGSRVEGCEVSRCYDCGITIQGSGAKQAAPSDIFIRKNYIHDCCQGWEDFLRNGETDVFKNCVFSGNLLVNNGNRSAFNYEKERFKYCQILGNNLQGNSGMIIRDNIFINGNFYCSGTYRNTYKSNVWINNKCYILRGQFLLSNYTGTKDVIRVPISKEKFHSLKEATENAIIQYRRLTSDETTKFIILDKKETKKLTEKYLFEIKK